MENMKAMIFAAGLGTRLKPLTDTMPKALVPVGGKPLLEILIRKLVASGFTEIVINVHHFADQIIRFVEEHDAFGADIRFSDESGKLLETGGGIKKAIPLLLESGVTERPFLVHNVDILSNVDLQDFYRHGAGAAALLLVSERQTQRYLLFDEENRLVGWTNVKTGEVKSPYKGLDVEACRKYAEMGIKGFKVDFLDRDDQTAVEMIYRIAAKAAEYKLILDYHGIYKPTGLNRTYPNVLNFEGVNGLEQMKWSPASVDQVKYDVMIPFTRQVSGPMDYTQGAMRNASKGNYYPCNSEPMSQGTRCRQLALYVVFESPFNMLCDTPSNYMREPESTGFIADVPTVWDESIVLDGKMGEYIVTARRSGNVWYVGGITDWAARDIEVDCSFLGDKTYDATLFKDGANAHRIGRDYKCESIRIKNDSKLKIHLAPGGGFALKIK